MDRGPRFPAFVDGTPEAIAWVVRRMRAEARLDCELCSHFSTLDEFLVNRIAVGGPKWAIELEGEPVAVGGLVPGLPGVHEAWICATDRVQLLAPRYLVKACRLVIKGMFEYPDVRRIQATVRAPWEAANRFALAAGLKYEGQLQAVCRNWSAVNVYAIVKGQK